MLKINIKAEDKKTAILVIRNLFLVLYGLLFVFSVLEIVKPRIITSYLDLNYFLLAVFVLGIITINYYQPSVKEENKISIWGKLTIILLVILIGIVTLYFTRQVGYLSLAIGLAGAIIAYFFINLNFTKE